MIKILLKQPLLLLFVGLAACGHAEKTVVATADRQNVAFVSTADNEAYSELSFDSTALEKFIRTHKVSDQRATQLRHFYKNRDYQFAWFNEDGLAQQAISFWSLHNRYVNLTSDSSFFNRQLHQQMKALLDNDEPDRLGYNITEVEMELTDHFFDYAKYAYAGKVDPDEIQWHIPRKKINAIALLDSLVQKNGKQLDKWEPVNQQYKLVRKELLRLYDIEKSGGWPVVTITEPVLRKGDSAKAVVQLKQRLSLSGDFVSEDRSPEFTPALKAAVELAQRRFGLTQDGVVGPKTLKALNVPVESRIEQVLVNMERMRWMPAQTEGLRLVANIPEYRLHVYEGNKPVFDMKIVVGKAAHRTVVFSDQLKYVVFSPYWNVPRSIVRNEILPAMNRNPGYLAEHNMEKTGTRGGLPVIRQKPGGSNALGRVKFIFPNSFNIYFHDTPAKSLFDQQRRAFSHGCIRLEQPQRLAEYILQNRPEWTNAKISDAMYAEKEKWVKLKKTIPVEIVYFTAWVDDEGKLNFRDDIYGHDKALADHLFQH